MPNYNSIESNVLFPSMEKYDMDTPGGMALYLACCDFYPFRSVIENNKIAIDLVSDAYRDMASEARERDDFITESWAMTSGMLQSCRVDILTQYSLLLTMVSLLEEAVNTLCRLHKEIDQLGKNLEETKGSGLERAAEYLKTEAKINGFKSDPKWEYITTIRDCRNMVVHNGPAGSPGIGITISSSGLEKRVNSPLKRSNTSPTAPLRCLAITISAIPRKSLPRSS